MAEKTFVDGICEFDRADDMNLRKELAEDRADIINQVLKEAGRQPLTPAQLKQKRKKA